LARLQDRCEGLGEVSPEVAREVAGSDLKEGTGEDGFEELEGLGGGDEGGLAGWISRCADTLGAVSLAFGSEVCWLCTSKSAEQDRQTGGRTGGWMGVSCGHEGRMVECCLQNVALEQLQHLQRLPEKLQD
jgi:hypothetical protein